MINGITISIRKKNRRHLDIFCEFSSFYFIKIFFFLEGDDERTLKRRHFCPFPSPSIWRNFTLHTVELYSSIISKLQRTPPKFFEQCGRKLLIINNLWWHKWWRWRWNTMWRWWSGSRGRPWPSGQPRPYRPPAGAGLQTTCALLRL